MEGVYRSVREEVMENPLVLLRFTREVAALRVSDGVRSAPAIRRAAWAASNLAAVTRRSGLLANASCTRASSVRSLKSVNQPAPAGVLVWPSENCCGQDNPAKASGVEEDGPVQPVSPAMAASSSEPMN